MPQRRVVLLTSTYPWGPGEEFITAELSHWLRGDVKLTIMPWRTTQLLREVPAGIEVDTRLDELRRKSWKLALARQAVRPELWRELVASVRAGHAHPRSLWRAVVPSAAADLTADALQSFATSQGKIDVAYSYWFDYQTLGALRAREAVSVVISRAHGYDIYEASRSEGRLPFRRWMAPRVHSLAPISDGGLRYVREHYGALGSNSKAFPLGVPIGTLTAPTPEDPAEVNILSVSSLTPVKRVHLAAAVLGEMSRLRPELRINWTHAGSGPLMSEAKEAAARLPEQVTVTWLGQLDQAALAEVYEGSPWNLMLNVSSSEGVPVSIMEAMERAIPAIVTDVGSMRELVSPPGGVLLDPDSSPESWAASILAVLPQTMEPEWRARFRDEVVENWNQDRNHAAFVEAIVQLASTPPSATPESA